MDEQETTREAAIKRVKAKRTFRTHLLVYLVVNAFLVITWLSQGRGEDNYPFWTILGWGLGLALHGWNVYFRGSITENEIRREMERGI